MSSSNTDASVVAPLDAPVVKSAVAQTIQAFDRLDIIVDNAGIAVLKSLFPRPCGCRHVDPILSRRADTE